MPASAHSPRSDIHTGVLYAFLAYGAWGLLTMYWKWLEWMPSLQIFAHRAVWTVVFILPLLMALGQWSALCQALRQGRTLAALCLTAALISINWLGFIWAVNHGQVVQASLGYFINPLLNVLLGVLVLHERLRPAQWWAIALAALGVGVLVVRLGQVPWLAFLLAASFAFYSLLRKWVPVPASVGLALESALITPLCFGVSVLSGAQPSPHACMGPRRTRSGAGGGRWHRHRPAPAVVCQRGAAAAAFHGGADPIPHPYHPAAAGGVPLRGAFYPDALAQLRVDLAGAGHLHRRFSTTPTVNYISL